MHSTKRVPTYRKIAEEYRSKIVSGELRAQTSIPSQTELATLHNTSVVTIQRALGLLVDDGLLYRVRKKGTFVADVENHRTSSKTQTDLKRVYIVYNMADVAQFSFDVHRFTLDRIQQICLEEDVELRMLNLRDKMELPHDDNAGFILWGFSQAGPDWVSAVERWKAENRRLVTLHEYFPHLDIPYVNCDDRTGGYLATQHLISLGHKRIGLMVSGKSHNELYVSFAQRMEGYRMALSYFGLAFDPELVYVDICDREYESSGYAGLQHLLANSNPPTAIFAGTDIKALGAIYAAQDMGLRIPDDLSIVGYDGYRFAEMTSPALTTVDQHSELVGEYIIRMLLHEQYEGIVESLVTPSLVIRESTSKR